MPAKHAVTEGNLGAWVVKCDPKVWDLAGFIAAGNREIDSWTIADNYRSAMMKHGDRVLLWVTSPKNSQFERGFWGSGWITGRYRGIYESAGGDEEPTEDFWRDGETWDRMRFFAPMAMRLWRKPVPESQVVAVSGLDELEVVRTRQTSNPSWVSADALAKLDPLLPRWPKQPPPSEFDEYDTLPGDVRTQKLVELAAIREVTLHYEERGYRVTSVERDRCGWDLTCRSPSGGLERVEVKGRVGGRAAVVLTANEVRSAREDRNWKLAVVTRALTSPRLSFHTANTVLADALPSTYTFNLGAV